MSINKFEEKWAGNDIEWWVDGMMDGWMEHGWMDGWMGRYMDGWMYRWMSVCKDGCDGWMGGCIVSDRIDALMIDWMGWVD